MALAQPEGGAPLQAGLHWLKPPIRARYAPGRRSQATARVAQPCAFQAQPPVVAVTVAQRQPFRQIVGVCAVQQREAFRARREGRYLGVIPARGMTPIRFVVRQPVGPISGRRGHLADEGRAPCAVSFRRPHDAEMAAFTARAERFALLGRADADDLAERLTLRDRDGDDRRLCLECTWLGDTGRCLAAATGRIPGADRRLEPVQTILQRCGAFGLRKGLV